MTAPTLREALLQLLGPGLADALADPNVTELYTVEGDSCAWLDTRDRGRIRSELLLQPSRVEMVLNTVATATGVSFGPAQPLLAAEVPDQFGRLMGRIQGFLPPVVTAPTLVFRKPAPHVYPLDDLVSERFLPVAAAEALRGALVAHETILIVGGTGTGKTTFLNSLLRELALVCPEERVAVLEDTPELVCSSPDRIRLRTSSGTTPPLGLYALLDAALRASPHRIVVGEVRDSSALAMLDAWNTGHPGGLATLHANTCRDALLRLATLVQRANVPPQNALIAATVTWIARLAGTNRRTRHLAELAQVERFEPHSSTWHLHTHYERKLP